QRSIEVIRLAGRGGKSAELCTRSRRPRLVEVQSAGRPPPGARHLPWGVQSARRAGAVLPGDEPGQRLSVRGGVAAGSTGQRRGVVGSGEESRLASAKGEAYREGIGSRSG